MCNLVIIESWTIASFLHNKYAGKLEEKYLAQGRGWIPRTKITTMKSELSAYCKFRVNVITSISDSRGLTVVLSHLWPYTDIFNMDKI